MIRKLGDFLQGKLIDIARSLADWADKIARLGGRKELIMGRTEFYGTILKKYIPSGCHTYSKADDQWPACAPACIERGKGPYVWDADRCVRSDAEGEREHGHGGEAGVLQQLAEGEFEIVHRSLSKASWLSFRAQRLHRVHVRGTTSRDECRHEGHRKQQHRYGDDG